MMYLARSLFSASLPEIRSALWYYLPTVHQRRVSRCWPMSAPHYHQNAGLEVHIQLSTCRNPPLL